MELNQTRATLWIVLARGTAQLSALAVLLLAARLLGPAELGAFVLVATVIGLLGMLADAGWGQYVIAWRSEHPLPAAIVWIALAAGAAYAAAGWLGAFVTGHLFADPRYAAMFFILASLLLTTPLLAVQTGRLIREGRVARQSQLTIAAELTGAAVALASLFYGAGIFALVAGRVVNHLVHVAGVLVLTRWLPRPHWDRDVVRDASRLVGHLIATRSVGMIGISSPELMIGAFLGTVEVGIYRTASRIVGAVFELSAEASRILSWNTLRNATERHGEQGTGEVATRFIGTLVYAVTPLYLGLAAISSLLVAVLLGPQWQPAAAVIAILAVARLAASPSLVNEALFGVARETRQLPRLTLAYTLTMLVALLLLARYGILWAALSQLVASLVYLPFLLRQQRRIGRVDWRALLTSAVPRALAAGALMALAALAAGRIVLDLTGFAPLALVGAIACGALTYAILLQFLRPDMLNLLRGQLTGAAIQPEQT